jgi:glycerol-3-phosphate dehydrogenase
VSARVTVNATGAAVDRLLSPLGLASDIPLLKAMNLVTTRDAGDVALGGRSASGRHLFLVPWRRRAVFGTWESSRACAPDDATASEADIALFIGELNEAFPALDLKPSDIALVHRGAVPASVGANGRVSLEGRDQVLDHAHEGVEGLVSVVGTKYTTARAVAERVTTRLLAKLNRPAVPCRTAALPLPGGHLRDTALTIAEARREHDDLVPSDTLPHLIAAYGALYRDVLELARDRPDWRTRLADDSPVIGAELVRAVRSEMALTLCDGVLRRTPLGAVGYPGDGAAGRAADIMGAELGWSDEQKGREIEMLKAFYRYGTSKA